MRNVFDQGGIRADKALKLAADLNEVGIAVDYVVLLDATNPPEVPGNVKQPRVRTLEIDRNDLCA